MTDQTPIYKIYEVRNDGHAYGQGSYLPVLFTEYDAALDHAREMVKKFSWCCDYRIELWYRPDSHRQIVWNSLQEVKA